MRPYATISPQFWTGSTGKRLRAHPDAQRVAFYLMTSPHSHQSGMYYLPMMYLCHEVGMTLEGAIKALKQLSDDSFCTYDETSEWIWVREMASWQIGAELNESDKRCKGVQQYLTTLPDLPFIEEFVLRYANDFHLTQKTRGLQGASEGASSYQEQEKEQEQEASETSSHAPAKRSSDLKPRRPSRRCPSDFAVTDAMRVWASTECPGVDVDRETANFRDYEYRNPKSDWMACWRTWIRKCFDAIKTAKKSGPSGAYASAI